MTAQHNRIFFSFCYLVSRLKEFDVKVTTLAQGIPMGAELDYMDEGTIQLALNSRKQL